METIPRNGDSVETLLKKILLVVGDTSSSTSWGDIIGTITAQGDLTTYVQEQIASALTSVVKKQGGIDCSTNPNFPAASNADLYFVTVAGKIGGANGPAVSIGDTAIAIADTAAGDFATVGQNWIVLNTNIPGLSTLGVLFATMNAPASPSTVRVNSDGTITLVSFAFNEQVDNYQLVSGDAGKTIRITAATDKTLTIPTDAVVNFPIGTTIEICQGGAGKITVGGAGVTIECPATNKRTMAQHAGASLKKRLANTWWLEGRLE